MFFGNFYSRPNLMVYCTGIELLIFVIAISRYLLYHLLVLVALFKFVNFRFCFRFIGYVKLYVDEVAELVIHCRGMKNQIMKMIIVCFLVC